MLLVAYALVLLLFLLALLRLKSWHDDGLPGPRRLPFIGMALELAFTSPGELLPLMKRLEDKFNGCLAFELIGYRYVLLYEPETIEFLLSSSSHIKKGIIDYELIRPLVSDGLIISSGPKWRYRRKLLTPTFHFKILEDAMDSLNRNSEILASNLLETSGKDVEVEDIVRSSTLKIICETAMGVKLNETDQQQNEYITAIKRIPPLLMKRFVNFWEQNDLLYNFTPSGKRLKKYIGLAHSFTKKVIASKKNLYFQENNPEVEHIKSRRKAFLDCLLDMNIADETVISNEGICEEVDTFMFEGHDTTSTSLAFTLFLLANHPEVQEKVAQEMYKIFGEDDRPATLQDLNKMVYLEMVIKESLRLYPSVPFISRYLTEDLRIKLFNLCKEEESSDQLNHLVMRGRPSTGRDITTLLFVILANVYLSISEMKLKDEVRVSEDLVIPAGYTAAIPIFHVHRSKIHWEEPEEFRPERFAPGTLRHPFAFIPFSAGPRNCIGQKFAMMELKTVLSTIIRRCEIEAVTKKVTPIPTAVMCCTEPIKIKVHKRKHQNVILNY